MTNKTNNKTTKKTNLFDEITSDFGSNDQTGFVSIPKFLNKKGSGRLKVAAERAAQEEKARAEMEGKIGEINIKEKAKLTAKSKKSKGKDADSLVEGDETPDGTDSPTVDLSRHSIITSSGLYMPYNCDPDNLRIVDIADGLSKKCRFGGQGSGFLSVAEHCICMVKAMQKDNQPETHLVTALLHDAAEAYWTDIPAPYKSAPELVELQKLEDEWLTKIFGRYRKGKFPIPDVVKEYDERIRINEVELLFPGFDQEEFGVDPLAERLDVEILQWPWREAKREFILLADSLGLGQDE